MNNSSLEFFKSLMERDTKFAEMLIENESKSVIHPSNLQIKPYSNIKFVNDILTIVLNDGNIISKYPAIVDDFQKARNAKSELELFTICMSKEAYNKKREQEKEIEIKKALVEGAKKLANYPNYFEVRDDSVYVKGINRSLPPLLIEEFLLILSKHNPLIKLDDNDNFTALYNFWMWCCLNPRAEVADKLFNFLKKNSFKITKQGFFTALRNVVTIHGNTELVQFVSESYNKIKAVWKKNPNNYVIFLKNGEYKLVKHNDIIKKETFKYCPVCDGDGVHYDYNEDDDVFCENCNGTGEVEECIDNSYADHGEKIGNLTDLYLDLPNRKENRFTDDRTRTFDIRVGKVVNMDPAKCRWNTDDCGAEGLHFTSDQINYVGCGDQSMLVLINPMKIVGIGEKKGRCWEYLPIMTVPSNEATVILHDLDFDTLELDEEFTIRELDNLEKKVKEGFTAEAKKYSINFPTISLTEVNSIVTNLSKMKDVISNRINKI